MTSGSGRRALRIRLEEASFCFGACELGLGADRVGQCRGALGGGGSAGTAQLRECVETRPCAWMASCDVLRARPLGAQRCCEVEGEGAGGGSDRDPLCDVVASRGGPVRCDERGCRAVGSASCGPGTVTVCDPARPQRTRPQPPQHGGRVVRAQHGAPSPTASVPLRHRRAVRRLKRPDEVHATKTADPVQPPRDAMPHPARALSGPPAPVAPMRPRPAAARKAKASTCRSDLVQEVATTFPSTTLARGRGEQDTTRTTT